MPEVGQARDLFLLTTKAEAVVGGWARDNKKIFVLSSNPRKPEITLINKPIDILQQYHNYFKSRCNGHAFDLNISRDHEKLNLP